MRDTIIYLKIFIIKQFDYANRKKLFRKCSGKICNFLTIYVKKTGRIYFSLFLTNFRWTKSHTGIQVIKKIIAPTKANLALLNIYFTASNTKFVNNK